MITGGRIIKSKALNFSRLEIDCSRPLKISSDRGCSQPEIHHNYYPSINSADASETEILITRPSQKDAFFSYPKSMDEYAASMGLTPEERYLHMLLLDRRSLSVKNNWRTEDGEIYCYFTIQTIRERLGCGNKKAIRMLDHLEEAGLIRRIKQGLGRPNCLIVENRCPNDIPEVSLSHSGSVV